MEDLEKPQNCQIEGWARAWRWALAQDNMVFAYHLHLQVDALINLSLW